MSFDNKSIRDVMNSRWNSLKTERSSWIDHWKDIQEYILPRRGRFLGQERNEGGKERHTKILDNTGTLAARTLASGLMAGLTSPARPWFRLSPPDTQLGDSKPVKVWLGQVESVIREIFARSNTYNALHTAYREIGGFGTSPIGVVQDFNDAVRCYPFTIGSYCLDVNEKLKPDTIFREIQMTSKMIVERFGAKDDGQINWTNISPSVKDAFERSNFTTEFTVIQAIEPNITALDIPGFKFMEDMGYRSIYWEEGAGKEGMAPSFLEVKGFHEQPFMAPRWDVLGTDSYGTGPGMDALGDVAQLQVQQRWKGEGISKQVNPPMVAPESLRDHHKTTIPGGVTYYAQGEEAQFRPVYQVQFQMNHLLQDMEETRGRISRAFYEDLFLMLTNTNRRQITAREIEERHEEKLLMLGPVLERLEDELLDPLVDRVFDIANRLGLLPPPPEELSEQDLKVEYISVLAQAQKAVALNALERTVGFIGGLAQMDPTAMDKLDVDASIDEYAEAAGLAPEAIRSTDEVEEIREGRRQQEEQQQQMAQMQQMADTLAPLANIETDKNTLAGQAMATAQGQGPVDVGAPV